MPKKGLQVLKGGKLSIQHPYSVKKWVIILLGLACCSGH